MKRYETTAAYISGGICGDTWMPQIKAGFPIKRDLRGPFGIMQKGDSFLEALRSFIWGNGGDFRDARFTADTIIRIERRRIDGSGRYSTHVREIDVSKLAPDYVDDDAYTGDFLGEE